MRKLWLRILILFYWIIGRGPWLVVGHYVDDEGRQCRFRCGDGQFGPLEWDDLDDANDYCAQRNHLSLRDPLGSAYYVWHELEFNHFYLKEKR